MISNSRQHNPASPGGLRPAHSPSNFRVRLGAGTRNVNTCRPREAADDLNHNVFALSRPAKFAADPRRPQGRSSSPRCGRSTSTPTAVHRPRTGSREHRGQNNPETTTDPTSLRGSSSQIRNTLLESIAAWSASSDRFARDWARVEKDDVFDTPSDEALLADPIARRPRIRRSPGEVALKFVSRLIRPAIVTGMMAALIATADTPTVVPLTCRIGGSMVGRTYIYHPVCTPDSPPSQPSPNGPPAGPSTPPGAPILP